MVRLIERIVRRHIKECDYLPFNDGEHIIYVIDKVRYFKETEEGVETMCKAMDDLREEVRIENARKMLANGKFSLDDVVECSGLPLEKVKELAENKTA